MQITCASNITQFMEMIVKIRIKKLHPDAIMPVYGSDGAACFDLFTINANFLAGGNSSLHDTGLAFEIPEGHVMLVFSRSGHGFKNDVRLSNCVGVIDHDYRGELKIKLRIDNSVAALAVKSGDRIAQGMIIPYPKVEFDWADELSDTTRGEGGFGSTGQ